MCYNVQYLKKKIEKYAERNGLEIDPELFPNDKHFMSAFDHEALPCITSDSPGKISALDWGLIPFWVKDAQAAIKISNQTPNAMGESIFEKPSFRDASLKKRCIVLINGFYEYHHLDKKTKIPYFITSDQETMPLAGLWQSWKNKEDGSIKNTVTIVTTVANNLMGQIHNNPDVIKRTGSGRMPVILPQELVKEWLNTGDEANIQKEMVNSLIKPYPSEHLTHHPVKKLLGNDGTGNTPEASKAFNYPIIGIP